jgi:hypothetical protein
MLGAVLLALVSMPVLAVEVGLVTAVSGNVKWQEQKSAASELKPFVKVRDGDQLTMDGAARLQLVYFESGRQETWQGSGVLEVGTSSSKTVKGSQQPEVKVLPAILVKQLSKTPASDGNVKTGMIRLRSMAPPIESVERDYAEMRKQADSTDRNPELFLLASYFERGEYAKLEALLGKMNEEKPGDPDILALNGLYSNAVSVAKAAKN